MVGLRLMLRNVVKVLHAFVTLTLVLGAIAVVGFVKIAARLIRLISQPGKLARNLLSRFNRSKISPGQ